jgi:plastocyanin
MKRRATLLLVLLSALLLGAPACSGGKPDVTVQMVDFTYRPVDLQVVQGESVQFTNATGNLHNFEIYHGPSLSLDVPAGKDATTDLLGKLKVGTYTFRCKYHYKQGMVGVLTISAPGS